MKIRSTIFLILTLTLIAAGTVGACECSRQQEIEKAINDAAIVFSGKVVDFEYRKDIKHPSITQAAQDLTGGRSYEILTFKFEVESWWKGDLPRFVYLVTKRARFADGGILSSSYDFDFELGGVYLVYGCEKDNRYLTDNCTRTRKLSSAEADLKILGPGKMPGNDLPFVDFPGSRARHLSSARIRRSSRYNTSPIHSKIRDDVSVAEVRSMHPLFGRLPALPLPGSDLVLIGTVKSASAFISGDETRVYSEFSIIPREVLFAAPKLGYSPGGKIFVSREGGNIKFPSGRIVTYSATGQGTLKPNEKYILFLGKTDSAREFTLLTAYRISGEVIVPVDVGAKFSVYRSFPLKDFIDLIKK